jgi:hypothetical protein
LEKAAGLVGKCFETKLIAFFEFLVLKVFSLLAMLSAAFLKTETE